MLKYPEACIEFWLETPHKCKNLSHKDFALSVELRLDLSLEYKERGFGGDEEVSHFCFIKKIVNKINSSILTFIDIVILLLRPTNK